MLSSSAGVTVAEISTVFMSRDDPRTEPSRGRAAAMEESVAAMSGTDRSLLSFLMVELCRAFTFCSAAI